MNNHCYLDWEDIRCQAHAWSFMKRSQIVHNRLPIRCQHPQAQTKGLRYWEVKRCAHSAPSAVLSLWSTEWPTRSRELSRSCPLPGAIRAPFPWAHRHLPCRISLEPRWLHLPLKSWAIPQINIFSLLSLLMLGKLITPLFLNYGCWNLWDLSVFWRFRSRIFVVFFFITSSLLSLN